MVMLREQLKVIAHDIDVNSSTWKQLEEILGEDFVMKAFTLYLYVKNDCKIKGA